MSDVASMMTAPDPGAAVGAKAVSAAGHSNALYRDVAFISTQPHFSIPNFEI